ncbi:drug/metabolite transporter (DMT)-like permease [Paraburkholderia silvatlantica]|uniref:Drug/metabolite transporter (DMT)-like permease n=2 Tax=Paraburkholderia silvatlantica TaxID=321895 RepID=A0A2U1AGQ3_9BURK|nr:drug/metabolite transporter (DMT)-like permease [Paraburkholderia silvatlantica]PVY35554.1 putative membrane protein [Paraburkholderia silvatlantica]PXW41196.1 putative membrane protein [Paraburkholderia silvatlantica]PYE27661.1 putative membrane protein [Paraburkholderia silvatlantica]TDQ76278.1 putative membrane protein [Paraburkholderia silvatlantica]
MFLSAQRQRAPSSTPMLAAFAPTLFVFLWSTGFVVARAIAPYADPNLFLLARFAGTAALFTIVALVMRAPWPRGREIGKHLFAGALLQGVYLGAGYWAVAQGLSAGVMALLGALQPLLTAAVAARMFGERLPPRRWSGMSLGLVGVVLVLSPKLYAAMHAAGGAIANAAAATAPTHAHANPLLVVVIAVVSVGSITAGTLYQKTSLAQADIRSASAVQNLGAAIVAAVLALVLGETRWIATPTLWFSLAWGIAMLSGAGVTLLVWMVRHGDAARATALLFLAPPLAALESWLLFGETLTPLQMAGFGVALAGVLLARRA